ncbi:lectin-like domain-containing protein, partial [Vibrio cholerae]|uniref:lectin-like domain-containing protein n=1 Tax=Vibrio cholerae TaxID=666 RepID=UPI0039C928E1
AQPSFEDSINSGTGAYSLRLNFDVNAKNRAGQFVFSNAFDMTQPISMSGKTMAKSYDMINPKTHMGDSNGIIISDRSVDSFATGETGGNLGIGGLGKGTYFVGVNYSFAKDYTLGDLEQGYRWGAVVS